MENKEAFPPEERMAGYLKKIATGPELSRDLTLEEARDGMMLILEGLVSKVQGAIFLIALRMKRETDEENKGVLQALRRATHSETAPVPELVELSDPFDGFNRHLPSSPFLLPVLAASGLPAISHGCHQMGPKFGVTHHQILASAGVNVDLTPSQVASRLSDPNIGWAYMDQRISSPALHRLVELRKEIIKRPCLSTLEKLCCPVQAKQKNHLFIGYVHKDYLRLLPLLALHAGYDSALVIKGVEGGIIPPLNAPTTGAFYLNRGEVHQGEWDPKEAGIGSTLRAVPLPQKNKDEKKALDSEGLAVASAKIGLEALQGDSSPTRDSLVYTAALLLHTLGRFSSISEAGNAVRRAIDSGEALRRFQQGRA